MLIYHGSKEVVEKPQILKTKYNKDFYFGFYCTVIEEQAFRWAVRGNKNGIVNVYEYTEAPGLNIKHFPGMTEEWLDFIANCRSGQKHRYDIVEGPMADDQIYNFIQNYMDGVISREAFWALAKFKKPTHQISFHTKNALKAIRFVSYREVSNEG